MTTTLTIAQIQALLASTPGLGYDIVPLANPPTSYSNTVNTLFDARHTVAGNTLYNSVGSGSMLQGGADTLVD